MADLQLNRSDMIPVFRSTMMHFFNQARGSSFLLPFKRGVIKSHFGAGNKRVGDIICTKGD